MARLSKSGGGLSTPEKLVSKNPAARREGEREATAGDVVKAARLSGGNKIQKIREISQRTVAAQGSSGGSSPQTTGNEAIKIKNAQGTKVIKDLNQQEKQAVAASLAEKKRILEERKRIQQQKAYLSQQENLKRSSTLKDKDDKSKSSRGTSGDDFRTTNVRNGDLVLGEKNYSTYTEEPQKGLIQKTKRRSKELEYAKNFLGSSAAEKVSYGTGAFILGAAAAAFNVVRHPIQTVKDSFSFGKSLITQPYETGYSIKEEAVASPLSFAGEQTGTYLVLKGVTEVAPKYVKNIYVKTGANEIPAEQVFAESVLSGKERLPTSKSTAESIQRFEQTRKPVKVEKKVGNKFVEVSEAELQNLPFTTPERYYASTASPGKISGAEAGIGKKASKGLEDPGIYVTPKGEGSPYFLRLGPDEAYQYSFNPVEGLKQKFSVPTVTEFEATAVRQYPRNVVNKPGFEGVKSFQEKQAGSGEIFITKRSEIGQGTVTRQKFKNPETGKVSYELGTSEIEAVIPYKQEFQKQPANTFLGKIKGFEEYTRIDGTNVAIRKAELVATKASKGGSTTKVQVISTEKLLGEQKSLSYQLSSSKGGSSLPPLMLAGSSANKTESNPDYSTSPGTSLPEYSPPSSSGSSSGSSGVSSPGSSGSSGGSSSSGSPSGSSSSKVLSSLSSGSSSSLISSSSSSSSGSSSSGGLSIIGDGSSKKKTNGSDDEDEDKKKDLFEVQVRRGGVFRTIGVADNIKKAVALGKGKVENTAAASFKIKGVKEQGDLSKIGSLLPTRKFRRSKKEAGVFIQKRRFRISSPGEKGEITTKGIFANKSKRKKRGVLPWG